MISTLLTELVKIAAYLAVVVAGLIWVLNQGKKQERAEQNENTLENAHKAKDARNDPDKRATAERLFERADK